MFLVSRSNVYTNSLHLRWLRNYKLKVNVSIDHYNYNQGIKLYPCYNILQRLWSRPWTLQVSRSNILILLLLRTYWFTHILFSICILGLCIWLYHSLLIVNVSFKSKCLLRKTTKLHTCTQFSSDNEAPGSWIMLIRATENNFKKIIKIKNNANKILDYFSLVLIHMSDFQIESS